MPGPVPGIVVLGRTTFVIPGRAGGVNPESTTGWEACSAALSVSPGRGFRVLRYAKPRNDKGGSDRECLALATAQPVLRRIDASIIRALFTPR